LAATSNLLPPIYFAAASTKSCAWRRRRGATRGQRARAAPPTPVRAKPVCFGGGRRADAVCRACSGAAAQGIKAAKPILRTLGFGRLQVKIMIRKKTDKLKIIRETLR